MAHAGGITDIFKPSQRDYDDKETPSDKDYKSSHDAEAAITEVESTEAIVLKDERDIATHVISLSDDPSLNPWTLRAFVIGIGLSAFGGVLGVWFYFRTHLSHHFQPRYIISNRLVRFIVAITSS